MNPLTLLPLLAAAAMAAPGVLLAQPALQLPLTQTIHYENRPVVTGYQSTVLKPALASAPLAYSGIAFARQIPDLPTNPAPPADLPGAPAPPADLPGGVNTTNPGQPPADLPGGPPADLPGGVNTTNPGQPPADLPGGPPADLPGGVNTTNPGQPPADLPGGPPADLPGGPPADLPGGVNTTNPGQPPADLPGVPAPGVPGGEAMNGTGSDNPLPIPGIPGSLAFVNAPANLLQVVNPIKLSAVAPQQVVAVRAAQAGDFEPLVTKEKVLAPVRTHTEITPQLTQIQPEIQVRRVIQEVPVASPVAYQTQYIQQLAGYPNLVAGVRIVA